MSEAIEAELRAIEALAAEAKSGNRPMFLQSRAFEEIGKRAAALRELIGAPLADLAAFGRVADIVASRMATVQASEFLRSEIETHVRSAVQAATAEERREQRLMLAVDNFLAGGPIGTVAEMMHTTDTLSYPVYPYGSFYHGTRTGPYARHGLQLRLARIVPPEALDRVLTALSEHLRSTYQPFPGEPAPASSLWDVRWSFGEAPTVLKVSFDSVFFGDCVGDISRAAFFQAYAAHRDKVCLVHPTFGDKPSAWTLQVGFVPGDETVWTSGPICTGVDPAPVPAPITANDDVDPSAPLWDPSWQPGGEPGELVISHRVGSEGPVVEETYPGGITRTEFLQWFKDYPRYPDFGSADHAEFHYTIRPKFAGQFVSRSTGMQIHRTYVGDEDLLTLAVRPVV